jgi:hypothetical protein
MDRHLLFMDGHGQGGFIALPINHTFVSKHPPRPILDRKLGYNFRGAGPGVCSFQGGFGPRQSSSDYFVLFFRWSAHSESCAALGGLGFHARDPTAIQIQITPAPVAPKDPTRPAGNRLHLLLSSGGPGPHPYTPTTISNIPMIFVHELYAFL